MAALKQVEALLADTEQVMQSVQLQARHWQNHSLRVLSDRVDAVVTRATEHLPRCETRAKRRFFVGVEVLRQRLAGGFGALAAGCALAAHYPLELTVTEARFAELKAGGQQEDNPEAADAAGDPWQQAVAAIVAVEAATSLLLEEMFLQIDAWQMRCKLLQRSIHTIETVFDVADATPGPLLLPHIDPGDGTLVDGTLWIAQPFTGPPWERQLLARFEGECRLHSICLGNPQSSKYGTTDYVIDVSADSAQPEQWSCVANGSLSTPSQGDSAESRHDLAPIRARWVRLTAKACYGSQAALGMFQAFGVPLESRAKRHAYLRTQVLEGKARTLHCMLDTMARALAALSPRNSDDIPKELVPCSFIFATSEEDAEENPAPNHQQQPDA
eukprot:m.31810 g.31810  ORF g.31810 m.31810 type:complete len:386 (-) comp9844_c0_seq2:2143-3300(-)